MSFGLVTGSVYLLSHLFHPRSGTSPVRPASPAATVLPRTGRRATDNIVGVHLPPMDDTLPALVEPNTSQLQGAVVSVSPRWSSTTKLVVALSVVAISIFFVFRFMGIVGPLLLAFILAYLFYPISNILRNRLHVSWRISVTFIYLVMLILLLGFTTVGGLAVIEQVQNLIAFLQTAIRDLPAFIADFTAHPLVIGPFSFNVQLLDVNAVGQQLLGVVQPILTQAGTNVVALASGMATLIGWTFFVLLVSYFILAESGGSGLFSLTIPGYADDFHRLGMELNRIWNAFLRNQITIVLITILIYNVLLGSLGMRFFFGLALLAGLARFIPYVGPFIAWTSYGLVSFFQDSTIFGLSPLAYVGLVVGLAWLTDMILDNVVVPRLMANALRVHPAAVMISALVAFNLLGVIGMILAAPVLATVKLFLDYLLAKLFDQNPWTAMDTKSKPLPTVLPWMRDQYFILRKKLIHPQLPPAV